MTSSTALSSRHVGSAVKVHEVLFVRPVSEITAYDDESVFSSETFLEEPISVSLCGESAPLPVTQQAFISQLKGPVTEWE